MSLTHRLISLQEPAIWEAALSKLPHTYAHTHWYNAAMQLASKREIFLYEAQGPQFHAICPISPRQKTLEDPRDITTPYGFSGLSSTGYCANFSDEWHGFMQSQGFVCGHIALHPFLQQDHLYHAHECVAGKTAYYLDLNNSLDVLYRNLADGHRQPLRQWQKKNFLVTMDKGERYINAFITHHSNFVRTKNVAKVYAFGEDAWRNILSSPYTFLFSVQVDDQIEAAAVFIIYQDIADYFMMASNEKGRAHARGILWHAITHCHTQKIRWLHLGCGIKENDDLEQFKRRFGGKPMLTYALKQVYNNDIYQTLCHKYNANARDRNGYFPSYWANN